MGSIGVGPAASSMLTVDWIVVGFYALIIVGIGLSVSRRRPNPEDYFLASRRAGWPMIGLAMLASNISSTTLIGLAGAAYATGISVYNYEWMATVVLVFFCVFFLPFLLRSQVYTLPEWLERRYGSGIRLYFSALTIFLNVVVDASGTLYGGSLMFHLILPDVPLSLVIAALAVLAGLYTVFGGLRAVMYTEMIQAVLLLSASVVIAFAAFAAAGGWAHVIASVPAEKLSLIRPASDPVVPWTGLISGVPLIGFYFWCTNQFMVQRVLSARNENQGRWGSLFAGLLKLPVLFLMVLPGTCAILIYPHLSKPDTVYPTLVFGLLPHGLIGLVVAGFLAALMSAVASTFNSASTLLTMDFVRRVAPGLDNRRLVIAGRIATITVMVLAVLWAPNIERFSSLWQYLQSILAYAVPPVVALFLVGLFWRRASLAGAYATIVAGSLAGMGLFWANVLSPHPIGLHFLLAAPLLFGISVAFHVAVSLLFPGRPSEGVAPLLWTPRYFREEGASLAGTPALYNYRIQSVLLLAATAIIVWLFR